MVFTKRLREGVRVTASGGTMRRQAITDSRHEALLSPGQEYVAMLWPDPFAGDGLVFPIVSGRISSPPGTPLSGMRLEEALAALGKWAREPRR